MDNLSVTGQVRSMHTFRLIVTVLQPHAVGNAYRPLLELAARSPSTTPHLCHSVASGLPPPVLFPSPTTPSASLGCISPYRPCFEVASPALIRTKLPLSREVSDGWVGGHMANPSSFDPLLVPITIFTVVSFRLDMARSCVPRTLRP
jgi:hypothetical protein